MKLANSEHPDETAHKEPSHQDFHSLLMYVRIYLMSEVTRLNPILSRKSGYDQGETQPAQLHDLFISFLKFRGTVLPANSDSDVMFCLQNYLGLINDISLVRRIRLIHR